MHWLPVAAAIGALLGASNSRARAAHPLVAVGVVVVIGVFLPRTVAMTGKAAWLPTALLTWSLLWSSLRVVAAVPTRFFR